MAAAAEADRVILCPFCRGQEPTCVVRTDRGTYLCVACKRSGDVSEIPSDELPDGVRWELESRHLL